MRNSRQLIVAVANRDLMFARIYYNIVTATHALLTQCGLNITHYDVIYIAKRQTEVG